MTPSGTTGLLLLAAGDVIGVDGDPRRLQLLEQPRALSELAPGGQRVRHPAFTAQAAQIPDTALARDLQTTVRPDLQIRVQEALEARLAPLVPNVPGEAKRNMRGAVLLMDGLTGAIAAAATFPARPEHLPIDERDNPARLRRLELNQNFELLPTGSAAKVPFAASLAKADPGLLAVTLRYADTHCVDWRGFLRTGEEKDCSRAASSQKIRDHGNGGSNIVTFRSFITHSNNFYAMNLLRLGRQRSGLEGPWLSNFRRFACAHPAGINPLMDESCPVYPWADARDPYRGAALAGLRPVFRENEIQRDPKYKFFEAIRGSIDFSWTTPQLAQAYARLLTGRGVTPRLVSGPVAGQADAFALQSAVWQAVRDGMHGVVTTGTASNYFRQWSPTPATYLLGKTGTPTLADGSDGSVFVLALAQTPGGGDPAEPTAICALKLIVVNFEFKPPRLASGFARDLLADPGVLAWATRPCGARR